MHEIVFYLFIFLQHHNLKPSINVSCIYYELVNVRMLTCLNYIVNMAHMSFVMPRFHSPFTDKTTWVDFSVAID